MDKENITEKIKNKREDIKKKKYKRCRKRLD